MGKKLVGAALIVAGSLCLLGGPAKANAQGNTWAGENLARMVEDAALRWGLLRVNAAFTLARAGYDSDIYYGYLAEPTPDWTLSAGVPVQVLVPLGKKVVLELFDEPQYLFYLETEKERAWNNTFQGRIHFALDRVYLQAGGAMADVRRRFSPELDINVREKRDGLNGLALWQAAKAASFAVVYEWARFDYGDAEYMGLTISERLNREEQHLDLVAYVQPSAKVRLFADGRYGMYTFTADLANLRDARSYGLFGGAELMTPGEEMGIRGGLRLGFTRLDVEDPLREDGSGFAGEGDISVDLTRKLSVRAFFSKGYQFSVYSGSSFYLSTTFGAGLSQRLSRKTAFSYSVSFGSRSYPEDADVQDLRDRYTTHAFSLNVRLARNLDVSLLGTLGRRKLDVSGTYLDRNFFGLNLTYGFSRGSFSSPADGLRP